MIIIHLNRNKLFKDCFNHANEKTYSYFLQFYKLQQRRLNKLENKQTQKLLVSKVICSF